MIGKNKEALDDAEKSILYNPDDIRGYNIRGQAKGMLKDYKGAIEDFTVVINKNPDNAQAFFNRMAVRLNLEDKHGACSDYKILKKLGEKPNSEMEEYCK